MAFGYSAFDDPEEPDATPAMTGAAGQRVKPKLDTPEARQKFVVDESIRQKVDPAFSGAIFKTESGRNLNPRARSPVGARGAAQIMPGTAVRLARDLKTTPDRVL